MEDTSLAARAQAIRHFNRFYTRQIGVLDDDYLRSPFSMTEARVLYELAQHEQTTATTLGADLGLDAGYLSRILRDFTRRGLLDKQPSSTDGRQTILSLTGEGRAAFNTLSSRSQAQFEGILGNLSDADQQRLVAAMGTVEELMGDKPQPQRAIVLRQPNPGDLGWIVQRHGAIYAQEYGWDERFEGLCAQIVADFVNNFKPKRERCWIAEVDGEPVGCVFIVEKSETVAKLRLLLVEPSARGMGIGARLVDECIRFSRLAGYSKITLWTRSVLLAARRIYARAGFRLVETEATDSGYDLVEEIWEMDL